MYKPMICTFCQEENWIITDRFLNDEGVYEEYLRCVTPGQCQEDPECGNTIHLVDGVREE